MARYLADTDWVIEYLNKNPQVRERLDAYRHEGVCVSAISVGELIDGAHGATNPSQGMDRLRDFLAGVDSILPAVTETAELFGRERHRLRQAGLTIGDLDLFIAATCLQHNLTLLTNNRRHFEMVERLRLISI
jgi:tRNA(fMet)-specific endonuclease VapC